MANIQRSASAPQVAQQQPFLVSDNSNSRARPDIRRLHTSLALTDLITPTPLRSGYQTPRADRSEDPFSLGGFFPSQLSAALLPERTEPGWNWLRTDEADSAEEDLIREDEHDGMLTHVMFDRAEDLKAGELILQEDKLGVLTLLRSGIFMSTTDSQPQTTLLYDRLLSPYREDNLLDNDAVYHSLSTLRQAHASTTTPQRALVKCDGSGPLFSPVEGAFDDKFIEDGSWQSMLSQGVSIVLDLLAF